MIKLGLGAKFICASILGFIGGAFTASKRRERDVEKVRNELGKMIRELKNTKDLLASKENDISLEIEKALENERIGRVDDQLKSRRKIKELEAQLHTDKKMDNAAL